VIFFLFYKSKVIVQEFELGIGYFAFVMGYLFNYGSDGMAESICLSFYAWKSG
jgi:hypothetical protein